MFYPEATATREQLWSPVQNTALWLAWWLHGEIATDAVIDAFRATQGHAGAGLMEVLRRAREATDTAPRGVEHRPLVSLVLAGPGDVPPLPAGSLGAQAVQLGGAGLVVADGDTDVCHVLVPVHRPSSPASADHPASGEATAMPTGPGHERLSPPGAGVDWHYYRTVGRVPSLGVSTPGDADALLRSAMDTAIGTARSLGLGENFGATPQRSSPRLAVGALSDAFGLPGLPPGVPLRAQRLMARADVVAATVEVARRPPLTPGVDAVVLPLLRAVRTARTVAVDYAQRELARAREL